MKRADLHIHTVLSPCGDLDMSPKAIVSAALDKNLDIIGITDHNSSLQIPTILEITKNKDIFILMGVEVNTKEEIHCLCYFETIDKLDLFQKYIEENINRIDNNPKVFGYQVVVDCEDNITDQIDYLLVASLNKSIDQIAKKVNELEGIFIPAHIDKTKYSVISQLGFFPPDLQCDAVEFFNKDKEKEVRSANPFLTNINSIYSSDAHYINDIARNTLELDIEEVNFKNIKQALNSIN